jgi:excisionase family DNA binding protein
MGLPLHERLVARQTSTQRTGASVRMKVSGVSSVVFDKKQLTKDIMVTISRFTDGKAAVNPEPRTVMTLQEIADYLRVTRSTIHRLLKRNQIPAFRVGRHWRFNVEEIDNWCSSRMLSKDPKADV